MMQHALEEAVAHLGAAIMQSLPSDDQIIMDHVKAANEILTVIVRAQRAAPDIEARITVLSDAFKSISKNTCCDNCREAALVARSAIASYVGLARENA